RYSLYSATVKLRDHPLLSYRNLPSWPPTWVWIGGAENKQPHGEIGILMRVTASQQIALNYRCFLWIEYAESTYIGCLLVSDYPFFRQLSKLLQGNCGHSIEKIGDLDLSF